MILCALDCASGTCSVAVAKDGAILSEVFGTPGLTHSQTLLVSLRAAMDECGLKPQDLDAVALTTGPGSFTGVKIGVAAAKGLAFPRDLPCIAVSSLHAAAANVESGTALAVLDARRGTFYTARFEIKNGLPQRLTPDEQLSAEAIAQTLQAGAPVTVTGDGAEKFRASVPSETLRLAAPDRRAIRAANVAKLAFANLGKTTTAADLRPFYLRAPQAERERLERLAAAKAEANTEPQTAPKTDPLPGQEPDSKSEKPKGAEKS